MFSTSTFLVNKFPSKLEILVTHTIPLSPSLSLKILKQLITFILIVLPTKQTMQTERRQSSGLRSPAAPTGTDFLLPFLLLAS